MCVVSVIVPCYNEESTIRLLLEAIYRQTYPRAQIEVVIADGLSRDHTRQEIANFQSEYPDLAVRVIDNEARIIPAGLNQAIATSKGSIIVRLDAHSVPNPDYIERSVAAVEKGLGDNVGGVWEIHPSGEGWISRSIAVAAGHPLGIGDARYRFTTRPQSVDTVPFGAFHKALVQRIGGFDETLLTNEDYEFNVRVRQEGGRVWLDPAIRSIYYSRPSLRALARQYLRYGFWKARMLSRYPDTLRWRQALPPLFVASLVVLALLVPWLPAARAVLAIEVLVYVLVIAAAAVLVAFRKRDPGLLLGLPAAIAVMHLSWGAALLWSLFTLLIENRKAPA
jgi:succinoglycan biosynthesis protein ExoA